MAFENFNTRHFIDSEISEVNDVMKKLEELIFPKLANLSPEERQQYGSINEDNKLIVNKVRDYYLAEPGLSSPDVDWVEFINDFDTRAFIESILHRLESLFTGLNNAKILHDWDNYKAALTDYNYAKYKNSSQTAGYEIKSKELAQFFIKTNDKSKSENEKE